MRMLTIGERGSLPSRERGLKQDVQAMIATAAGSLPSRERGLKHDDPDNPHQSFHFAPFTGAWIETQKSPSRRLALASLPSRERGLKQGSDGCYPG